MSAATVELKIGGFLRLITSILKRKFARLTASIQRPSASNCGGKKWIIFKSSVPTVTASKRGASPGHDIACKRIEEAYRQPDMFVGRPAPPEQLDMLGGDDAA